MNACYATSVMYCMSAEGLSVQKPFCFMDCLVSLSLAFFHLPPQPLAILYMNELCKSKEEVTYKCWCCWMNSL